MAGNFCLNVDFHVTFYGSFTCLKSTTWDRRLYFPSEGMRAEDFYLPLKIRRLKCTLVQSLRLCTGHMAHRGSRDIALPFHDHGTRRGWEVSIMPWPLFTPGKDPVSTVQEAGWAPGPVWTGTEYLTPTGIRSPDRPACSHSPNWLRYPAHGWNSRIT